MFLVTYISNLFSWGDYIYLRYIPTLPDLDNASEGSREEKKRVLVHTRALFFYRSSFQINFTCLAFSEKSRHF